MTASEALKVVCVAGPGRGGSTILDRTLGQLEGRFRNKRLPDFGDDRLMQRQPPLVSARRWSLWQTVTELLWRGRPGRYLRLCCDYPLRPRGG
jgi:hypothetical protein